MTHWQIENYINEARLKQAEIFDYKKRLAEAETRYRQQQSLFEVVRAERNSYSKSLVEAQEEIRDLRSKLKITSQQVEQLKEDIAAKEASLVKEEFRKTFQLNVSNSIIRFITLSILRDTFLEIIYYKQNKA